jgi:hypothetical protein
MLHDYSIQVLNHINNAKAQKTIEILDLLGLEGRFVDLIETELVTNNYAKRTKQGLIITANGRAFLLRLELSVKSHSKDKKEAEVVKGTGNWIIDLIFKLKNEHPVLFTICLIVVILLIVLYIFVETGAYKDFLPSKIARDNKVNINCKRWTIIGRIIYDDGKSIPNSSVTVGSTDSPFNIDESVNEGLFTITDVNISQERLLHLYIKTKEVAQESIYEQQIQDGKHEIDTPSCTIKIKEAIRIKRKVTAQKPARVFKTYFITDGNFPYFDSLFYSDGYLKKPESKNRFTFSYTGDIESVSKNLFRYNGGKVKILLNGAVCVILEDFKLPATSSFGNSLSYVKEEIENNITEIVNRNRNVIYKKLRLCII